MVLADRLRGLHDWSGVLRGRKLAVLKHVTDPLIGVTFGVCLILLFFGFVERHSRIHNDHRSVCAIQHYIETRYQIDVKYKVVPHAVLVARRQAIIDLMRQARTRC